MISIEKNSKKKKSIDILKDSYRTGSFNCVLRYVYSSVDKASSWTSDVTST